jgi:hypothetical protein
MPLRSSRAVRLLGTGLTKLDKLSNVNKSPSLLMQEALVSALNTQNLTVNDLDGLIAVPSLAESHFMEAHHVATKIGLLPGKSKIVRTMDTGGSGLFL